MELLTFSDDLLRHSRCNWRRASKATALWYMTLLVLLFFSLVLYIHIHCTRILIFLWEWGRWVVDQVVLVDILRESQTKKGTSWYCGDSGGTPHDKGMNEGWGDWRRVRVGSLGMGVRWLSVP